MQDAFGTVVWVVCIAAAAIAVVALLASKRAWSDLGQGRLLMDHDRSRGAPQGSAAAAGERDAEIRGLLAARNARRQRRGEAPLDVERELARLAAPPSRSSPGRLGREPGPSGRDPGTSGRDAGLSGRDAGTRGPDPAASGREPRASGRDPAASGREPRTSGREPRAGEPCAAAAEPEPHLDPALIEEMRQLVEARNLRRVRTGQAPLDVEAELARELRNLTHL